MLNAPKFPSPGSLCQMFLQCFTRHKATVINIAMDLLEGAPQTLYVAPINLAVLKAFAEHIREWRLHGTNCRVGSVTVNDKP